MTVVSAGHPSRLPARLLLACLVMGLTALIAQVTLTRELLGLFYGNELSIAAVLAVWLLVVAAGSAAGARLVPGLRAVEAAFGWSQLITAALLPLSLLVARRAQPAGLTPGQVLGPGAMVFVSLEVLALVCLALGFQFVLAARAAVVEAPRRDAASAVGGVYALEAVGAVIGGAAFHWWLAEHVEPLRTLAVVGLLDLLSGTSLLRPRLPAARALLLPCSLAAALALLSFRSQQAELATLRASARWSRLGPVAFSTSRYGPIVITRQGDQTSFFQTGVLLFTSQDEYASEVAAQLPLLEHPAPHRVLVIGSALAGLAREALKHPVARLDCVELDPRVLELARAWLPPSLLRPLDDARVHLHVGDGRRVVRSAASRYDVIIVNLPDPTTAALNRFYTADFFREAKRALAPHGLLAVGLTGSEAQLSGAPLLAAATTRRTLAAVFPQLLIVPGERMLLLASPDPGLLTSDWRLLSQRFHRRRIRTGFVNQAWLRDALFPLRAELVQAAIASVPEPRLNTDLNPVSYYHQTRIWLDQLSPGLARLARPLTRLSVWWGLIPVVLAALLAALLRGRRRTSLAVLVGAAAIGAFGMVVEVLALLAFQSACGYLYHALAALMAAFMVGLAVGAAVMSRRPLHQPASARLLIAALAVAAGLSALLPGLLGSAVHAPGAALPVLGVLLACVGSLVGGAFPVLTVLHSGERDAPAAAGAIYAADLVGSAGAAAAAGAFAVPLLGVAGVSFSMALCLVAALVLALSPTL